MVLPILTPAMLLDVVTVLAREFPDVYLVKNTVGNLALIRNGEYIGYLDLQLGNLIVFEEGNSSASKETLPSPKE